MRSRLEQIKDLSIKTLDEDELIALLESNASLHGKRDGSAEEDDGENTKAVEKKNKRQKR
jgi:BRCT domain type II-containing protein